MVPDVAGRILHLPLYQGQEYLPGRIEKNPVRIAPCRSYNSIALDHVLRGHQSSLMEPTWYGRKIIGYEVVFGLMVMLGLYFIFDVGTAYSAGILLALVSAFLGAVFTLINGRLIKTHKPSVIGFYELLSGALFVSAFLFLTDRFSGDFFALSASDLGYIAIGIVYIVCPLLFW